MAQREFEKPGYIRNESIHPAWQKVQEKTYPALIWAVARYHVMPGYGIKREGWNSYMDTVRKIKNGERKPMSEMAEALRGFEVDMQGLNSFEGLSEGKFFVVGNHSSEGPLRGLGETFLVNRAVRLVTEKEVRWVQGMQGGSSPNVVHEQIAYTANSILVPKENGTDTLKKIFSTLREGNPVGIYPEGDKYKELARGDERAGAIFRFAAKNGIPLVLAGTSFENDRFTLKFDRINPRDLLLIEKECSKEEVSQEIVDYTMGRLAQLLPEWKRGFYKQLNKEGLLPDDGGELVS